MGIARSRGRAAAPLAEVGLDRLMAVSRGRASLVIGLIDGPIAFDDPDFDARRIRLLVGRGGRTGVPTPCPDPLRGGAGGSPAAPGHGAFVARVLVGRRGGPVPAICPGCSLLSRPVAPGATGGASSDLVHVTPGALAAAIEDCVDAGAVILNIGAALPPLASAGSVALTAALGRAARRGVLVLAAVGHDGVVGGSALTRHPWVVPVAASPAAGASVSCSFGIGLGKRGVSAPGDGIASLAASGEAGRWSGPSAATPLVTGAAALLWSALPAITVDALRHALLSTADGPRTGAIPPRLDAWAAYAALQRGSS